jgi:hypothetical protein
MSSRGVHAVLEKKRNMGASKKIVTPIRKVALRYPNDTLLLIRLGPLLGNAWDARKHPDPSGFR